MDTGKLSHLEAPPSTSLMYLMILIKPTKTEVCLFFKQIKRVCGYDPLLK